MSVTLHTYDGGTVNAINDAKFYERLTNSVSGVVTGADCTPAGGLIVHITAGWGVILGRLFTIERDDIDVEPSASGTMSGRLKMVINLANDPPISFESERRRSLPALTQENLNTNGSIYEIELCHYDVTELAIDNLVSNTKVSFVPVNETTLRALAIMQNAGITDLQFVNALPGTPNRTTLYFIPE